MTFEMTPVVSSNITAVGHDPLTSTLRIQFNSGVSYDYQNVPSTLHNNLITADSIGSFFSKQIKSNPTAYPFTKVL